jgi:hypothetical protein
MRSVALICPRSDASWIGHDHIAAQGEVSRLELKSAALLLGLGDLDRAAHGAEHIGHVAQGQLRGIQAVGVVARDGGAGQRAGREFRAVRTEAALHIRKETRALREIELVRLLERRLGGVDVGVGLERLFDQQIQRG